MSYCVMFALLRAVFFSFCVHHIDTDLLESALFGVPKSASQDFLLLHLTPSNITCLSEDNTLVIL